jgi:hypothetical protein
MTTIVRHLVNDIDSSSYTFATDRVETTILVAAQLMIMNVDFNNTYEINVEASTLSPDPTDTDTKDNPFIALACLLSIKDGPSAIDLRGVTNTLTVLYQDLCKKYEDALLDYRAGNSVVGQSVLGPYSPGSHHIRGGTYSDDRSGGYF